MAGGETVKGRRSLCQILLLVVTVTSMAARLLSGAGLMDSRPGSSSGTAVSCCSGHGSGGRGDCRLQQRQWEHACAGRTGKGWPPCSWREEWKIGLQKRIWLALENLTPRRRAVPSVSQRDRQ